MVVHSWIAPVSPLLATTPLAVAGFGVLFLAVGIQGALTNRHKRVDPRMVYGPFARPGAKGSRHPFYLALVMAATGLLLIATGIVRWVFS